MSAGNGGFTGAADAEGPVAGYDPVMGQEDKVIKKHKKKKGIKEETFKEKQAAARKRLKQTKKKAIKSGKDGIVPTVSTSLRRLLLKIRWPWSTNPNTVKVQKKLDKLSGSYGKSAKDKGYSLHDWFKGGGWKQTGGKYDGKPCAKQPGQTTKPFCRDADDRAAMSKDERDRRAAKKRREDPNADRKGKAKMVHEENLEEKKNCWPGYEKKGTKKMFGKDV